MARCNHIYHYRRQAPFQPEGKKTRMVTLCLGLNRATHREEICDDGLIWKPLARKTKPKKKQSQKRK